MKLYTSNPGYTPEVMAVRCPQCNAEARDRCRKSAWGKPHHIPHASRWRAVEAHQDGR